MRCATVVAALTLMTVVAKPLPAQQRTVAAVAHPAAWSVLAMKRHRDAAVGAGVDAILDYRVTTAPTAAVTLGMESGKAATGPMPATSAASAQDVRVERVATADRAVAVPVHVGGRVVAEADGLRRQWPGTYVEARFHGPAIVFDVGPGDVALRVSIDDRPAVPLVRPRPGTYRIGGLSDGDHRLRIDVVSESLSGPTVLGAVRAPPGTTPLPPPRRNRQIEFIGDSHTVGYGNSATKRDCAPDEIRATTDTSRGPAALTAAHYDADYQVNAISGRGIVRNYANFTAPTIPAVYPLALFDTATRYHDAAWHPSVIVIGLGTNDFSTPLGANAPWPTRDALREDYVASYVRFVRSLRRANPHAFFVLWATDLADGEIAAQVARVADRLRADGEHRITFVRMPGLAFAGCDAHPDLADDRRIAATLVGAIDTYTGVWPTARRSPR